jgi:hypothetical protein
LAGGGEPAEGGEGVAAGDHQGIRGGEADRG